MGRDKECDAEENFPNLLLLRVVQQVAKLEARQPWCRRVS